MYKDNYVIITETGASGGLENASDETDIEINEAQLSEKEQISLRRDPQTRGMAPAMPWRLIDPLESTDLDGSETGENTWGIEAVGASSSPYDGEGVTVCVLDTGIDLDHPAFAGVKIETMNFTDDVDSDTNGHGTHCAGTIFGQDVAGTRIGVARNIDKAMIGKVLGKGSSSTGIVKAINWAKNGGAHVVSMSLGIDFPGYVDRLVRYDGLDTRPATSIALEAYRLNVNLFTDFYQSLISQSMFGDGIVIIAATGNESRRPNYEIAASPPAVARGIISVGALENSAAGMHVAMFSNTGPTISAPGVRVISAKVNGGLVAKNGTSMATPHVAGVAALWAQRQIEIENRLDSQALEAQLIASATRDPLAPNQTTTNVGVGLVQAPQS